MNEMLFKKTGIVVFIAVLFVVVSLSDTTYSLFFNTEETNLFNYNTGIIDLKITEDKPLNLENILPTIDSLGEEQEPYKLVVENTGNIPYIFDLMMYENNENEIIDTKYIKVKVNDMIPNTLYNLENKIVENVILYPGEKKEFIIKIWLDSNTPNNELGKTFSAKIVTKGESFYKTLDNSGANYPMILDNMIPVYYDESVNSFRIADINNKDSNNMWYDYNNGKWANVIILKNSEKQLNDVTGNNNIKIDSLDIDNNSLIISNKSFDMKVNNLNGTLISQIFKLKINDESSNNIYIISNDSISYYYDRVENKFIFKYKDSIVKSSNFNLINNTWYTLGYSYDGDTIKFYVNGKKISYEKLNGNIGNNSFQLGSNKREVSKLIINEVYTYNRIISDEEFNSNFNSEITYINDGLLSGYKGFSLMNNLEYYHNLSTGSIVNLDDVLSFYVWIPRYKYKLWNITGSSNTLLKEIEIVFENNLTSSGIIKCQDFICYSNNNMNSLISDNDNGKFYTHPAFSKTDKEVYGFWTSKYEINDINNLSNIMDSEVAVIEDLSDVYKNVIKLGDKYHVIKNTEWGAISYLTYSKYGIYNSNKNYQLQANSKYISGNSILDSSTGNMYGIFDMNGSYPEIVMANHGDNLGVSLNNNEFSGVAISNDNIDIYNDNFILGDATYEVNNNNKLFSNGNWLVRGENNMFDYNSTNLSINNYYSTRIVIK